MSVNPESTEISRSIAGYCARKRETSGAAVDDPGKRIQLRTRRRPAPPGSGWHRKRQHLGYCPRVNPKLPRRFPSAQTLDLFRVTNPPIKLHHLHPPPSAITPKGYLLP
jgi:hypothetical protein